MAFLSCLPSYAQTQLLSTQPLGKLASALHKARKEVSKLFLTKDDLAHLSEYFEFYASWYAAVTPASNELRESLCKQALDFIKKIKKIAKPLERKPDRRLMGASRLSDDGKIFYKKVTDMLKRKIKA